MRVATFSSAASMWSISSACILWACLTDLVLKRSEERQDRKFLKSMCSASYQWIQAARIRVDDWPRRISVAWSSAQKSMKPNRHHEMHVCQCRHWPTKKTDIKVKKVKAVNLYSTSSCIHTSNALFVTNQSRRLHSRHVQPANTGCRTSRPGSPVSCTKVPNFRNSYNGLLLI